jgi:DNA-directed RNA polymerase subunit K/omega
MSHSKTTLGKALEEIAESLIHIKQNSETNQE